MGGVGLLELVTLLLLHHLQLRLVDRHQLVVDLHAGLLGLLLEHLLGLLVVLHQHLCQLLDLLVLGLLLDVLAELDLELVTAGGFLQEHLFPLGHLALLTRLGTGLRARLGARLGAGL